MGGFGTPNLTLALNLATFAYTQKQNKSDFKDFTPITRNAVSQPYEPVFNLLRTPDGTKYFIAVKGTSDNGKPFDENPELFSSSSKEEIETDMGRFNLGIYKSAMFVMLRIYSHISQQPLPIFISGHSYGASVASVLHVLLKKEFPNIDVQTVGFAPIPVMSVKGNSDEELYTIITEEDLIPRLSVQSVYNTLKSTYPLFQLLTPKTIDSAILDVVEKYNVTGFAEAENLLIPWLRVQIPQLIHQAISTEIKIKHPSGRAYLLHEGDKGPLENCRVKDIDALMYIPSSINALQYHTIGAIGRSVKGIDS